MLLERVLFWPTVYGMIHCNTYAMLARYNSNNWWRWW